MITTLRPKRGRGRPPRPIPYRQLGQVPAAMVERLDALAQSEAMTRSDYLSRRVLFEWLRRHRPSLAGAQRASVLRERRRRKTLADVLTELLERFTEE